MIVKYNGNYFEAVSSLHAALSSIWHLLRPIET